MADMARRIHELEPTWVLVKGGHLPGVEARDGVSPPEQVADVLFDGPTITVLTGGHVDTSTTTGPDAPSRRPSPPPWPVAPTCPRRSAVARSPSSPPCAAGPGGISGRAMDRSTISAGPTGHLRASAPHRAVGAGSGDKVRPPRWTLPG